MLALNVDLMIAQLILSRLRKNLTAFNSADRSWRLSVSTGVAIADGNDELEAVMSRADAAMYETKRKRPKSRKRTSHHEAL